MKGRDSQRRIVRLLYYLNKFGMTPQKEGIIPLVKGKRLMDEISLIGRRAEYFRKKEVA